MTPFDDEGEILDAGAGERDDQVPADLLGTEAAFSDDIAPGSESELFPTFAGAVGETRWVWHPAVHQRFSEACFFFLCRLSTPRFEEIAGCVGQILNRAGIKSASVYPVLGQFDVLVRVWASEDRRRRFLFEVRRSPDAVEQILEFRVDDHGIEYDWWDGFTLDVAGPLERHLGIAKQVATADRNGQLQVDAGYQELLAKLKRAGLVQIIHPTESTTDIKFYVVLQAPASAVDLGHSAIADRVRSFVSNGLHAMGSVSLYHGTGFGLLLLKAVVPSYSVLTESVEKIAGEAADVGLRPMTLALVRPISGECDSIENLGDSLSPGVQDLIMRIQAQLHLSEPVCEEIEERFAGMNRVDREAYVDLVDRFSDVFESDHGGNVASYGLLYALICDDVDLFGDSLNFLQKMESLLRRHLRRGWVELYGPKSWETSVKECLAQGQDRVKELAARSSRDWTLRDLPTISASVAKSSPSLRDQLEAELGGSWQTVISRISALRNDVAHGYVYEYSSLARFWPRVAGEDKPNSIVQVLEALELYHRLSGLVD